MAVLEEAPEAVVGMSTRSTPASVRLERQLEAARSSISLNIPQLRLLEGLGVVLMMYGMCCEVWLMKFLDVRKDGYSVQLEGRGTPRAAPCGGGGQDERAAGSGAGGG